VISDQRTEGRWEYEEKDGWKSRMEVDGKNLYAEKGFPRRTELALKILRRAG
jgi:hypothetical protein